MSPKQTHWYFRLGILRISFFKLRNKFCLRIELSQGWE